LGATLASIASTDDSPQASIEAAQRKRELTETIAAIDVAIANLEGELTRLQQQAAEFEQQAERDRVKGKLSAIDEA
jgi:predicted  nucleic acid-binding Zn-ribbon protein